MAEKNAVSHSNNFAIMHFICACMVVYGHQFTLMNTEPPTLLGNTINGLGVKMIFVITGYLIAKSFLRDRKFGNYMKRRLIRIYPAYTFVLLACAFVIGPVFTAIDRGEYFSGCGRFVINNLIFNMKYALPGVFMGNPVEETVNGSVWTIPVEIAMYVVVALLCMILIRKNSRAGKVIYCMAALAFAAAAIGKSYIFPEKRIVFWGTEWLSASLVAVYIILGALFAVLKLEKYCNLQAAVLIFIIACSVRYEKAEIFNLFVIPYFVMSFSLCEKPFFGKLFRKNNIAYGVFLWGYPVQQICLYVLNTRRGMNLGENKMFVISLAISTVLALLMHRFIEIPVEGFLRKHLIKEKNK